MNKLITLIRDESGANLIEYALLAAVIAIAAIAAILAVGQDISNELTNVGGTISR